MDHICLQGRTSKLWQNSYNWSSFLDRYFNKLPNIKKYHHFRFSKDESGKVYFKEFSTSPEQSRTLLKNSDLAILPPASMLPPTINPEGLSQDRKQYLFREIRTFCKPGTEDLVAPPPWILPEQDIAFSRENPVCRTFDVALQIINKRLL